MPPQVTLKLFDDNADAEKATEVALQIVVWSPNAIVGHFASAAAETAAPLYAELNLLLFLPAATAKHLTKYPTTWRTSDNDENYVCWLLPLLTSRGQDAFTIDHDGSVHGKSVTHQLNAAVKLAEYAQQTAIPFFAGSFRYALERAVSWARCYAEGARLILADGAFSEELVPELLANSVHLDALQIYVAAIDPHPSGEGVSTLTAAA